MMKFEWPLILPENEAVKRLAAATRDISEYVVELAKAHGLAAGPTAPSRAASPCITPATPGPRTWAPSRPRCCG